MNYVNRQNLIITIFPNTSVWYVFCLIKPQVKFLVIAYKYQVQSERCITQRSLQNVLIFRLLLKITVEGLRECVSNYFLSPCGAHLLKNWWEFSWLNSNLVWASPKFMLQVDHLVDLYFVNTFWKPKACVLVGRHRHFWAKCLSWKQPSK